MNWGSSNWPKFQTTQALTIVIMAASHQTTNTTPDTQKGGLGR
jgi:hypothetical protein